MLVRKRRKINLAYQIGLIAFLVANLLRMMPAYRHSSGWIRDLASGGIGFLYGLSTVFLMAGLIRHRRTGAAGCRGLQRDR